MESITSNQALQNMRPYVHCAPSPPQQWAQEIEREDGVQQLRVLYVMALFGYVGEQEHCAEPWCNFGVWELYITKTQQLSIVKPGLE